MSDARAAQRQSSEHVLASTGGCIWACPSTDHARHDMSGETFSGVYGHRLAVCPACGQNVCIDCDTRAICRPDANAERES